jgi:hypothetical protein
MLVEQRPPVPTKRHEMHERLWIKMQSKWQISAAHQAQPNEKQNNGHDIQNQHKADCNMKQ